MADRFKPWRDYLENILVAIVLALVVRTFVLTGYQVPTMSMAPTLVPGDFILAYRLPYGIKIPFSNVKLAVNAPEKGEVVVFTFPEQPRVSYVKRVVAVAGDRVQVQAGRIFVNGEPLDGGEVKASLGPFVVSPNEVFVIGDSREGSEDSHYWGTVPIERIEGRVVIVWLSLDWQKKWALGWLPSLRSERVFSVVH